LSRMLTAGGSFQSILDPAERQMSGLLCPFS
jgi:hypothetical protein